MKKDAIYLGKNGKTFGPYTEEEFQNLMTSGELSEFSWIWDHAKSAWKTIDQPPPMPVGAPEHPSTKKQTQEAKAQNQRVWSSVQAILYNAFSLIQGELNSVTETGCQLVCQHPDSQLAMGSVVSLNLFEPSTTGDKKGTDKKSHSVTAKILAIEPAANGQWNYLLRWEAMPNF